MLELVLNLKNNIVIIRKLSVWTYLALIGSSIEELKYISRHFTGDLRAGGCCSIS
jgi:hypothetical protein